MKRKRLWIGALACSMVIGVAWAGEADAPRRESGWLDRIEARVERMLDRLEKRFAGRGDSMEGCRDMMAGGGMMGGGMMGHGGMSGGGEPNSQWDAPRRDR